MKVWPLLHVTEAGGVKGVAIATCDRHVANGNGVLVLLRWEGLWPL